MTKSLRTIFCILVATCLLIAFQPLLGSTNSTSFGASKVKLSKTKITLDVGASKTLKVKGTSKNVKWSSSKKAVATVSKAGKVSAKKKGTTTITAKIGKKKYKCKVTVKNPLTSKTIRPNFALSKDTVQLNAGESTTITLKGKTRINKAKIHYTNSKTVTCKIVSSKGQDYKITIKALSDGESTITVTGYNGSKIVKDTIKVTVGDPRKENSSKDGSSDTKDNGSSDNKGSEDTGSDNKGTSGDNGSDNKGTSGDNGGSTPPVIPVENPGTGDNGGSGNNGGSGDNDDESGDNGENPGTGGTGDEETTPTTPTYTFSHDGNPVPTAGYVITMKKGDYQILSLETYHSTSRNIAYRIDNSNIAKIIKSGWSNGNYQYALSAAEVGETELHVTITLNGVDYVYNMTIKVVE